MLMANPAAALDRPHLTRGDHRQRAHLAELTRAGYCTGCGDVCESALAECPPVADVMRYLMYSRNYGDHRRARARFERLSVSNRRALAEADYAEAERRCPQGLPIGRLMREALAELG